MVKPRSRLPAVIGTGDGDIIASLGPSIGRYHRNAIAIVYQRIGGHDGLQNWAQSSDERLDMFYTRLLPRIIPKETEVQLTEGVEALLAKLDAGDHAKVINATAKEVDDEG